MSKNFVDNSDATALMGAVEQSIQKMRIFKGTLDEWDALTAAEQAKYSYIATPDGYFGSIADAVTDGDMRPVTSNAVYDEFVSKTTDAVTNGDMRLVTSNAVYDKFAVLEGTLPSAEQALPLNYPSGFNVDNCFPISALWEENPGVKRDYWYGTSIAVNVQLYTQYVYVTPRNSAAYGKKVWVVLMKF